MQQAALLVWFRRLLFHHNHNHLVEGMVGALLAGLTSTVEMAGQAAALRFLQRQAQAAQGKQFSWLLKAMPVGQTRAT
jgi:hypothetical protein